MENRQQFVEQGISREIRFAVVMYGGVSLAIYINGIAQELLKMCRASSTHLKNEELTATELTYRRISALMADEERLEKVAALAPKPAKSSETAAEKRVREADEKKIELIIDELIGDENRPLIKFVVDILTGTSAGGINAIFLAKALANNQEIAQLKDLWLDEGDIKVLLNDKKSTEKTNLNAPENARSLLNSHRMYLKLLEAFDGMGRGGETAAEPSDTSFYTNEIDLFVPVTDFRGTVVPLRLLDRVVEEKRYGQVFRFRYEKDKVNDFNNNDPMLAFAARSTSSFPFAFEPMRLSHAFQVIDENFADAVDKRKSLKAAIEKFFPKIIKKNCRAIDWTERDLVDGGVLDNKPFGYAIDVLDERRADFLCERKLLYIEPSPEVFQAARTDVKNPAPNVISNALASISSIPSYETIREDLERLLERNKLIERVTEIIKKSEKDVFEYLMTSPKDEELSLVSGEFWKNQGLDQIAKWKGRAVLPYYRLRIAELTDDIARLAARIFGVEEETENFLTLRIFVKAWRDDVYSFYKADARRKDGENGRTVLSLLHSFDMKYRLRRLRFVQEKAGLLYRFERNFRDDLQTRADYFGRIKTEPKVSAAEYVENVKKEADIDAAEDVTVKTQHPFVEEKVAVSRAFLENLRSRKQSQTKAEAGKNGENHEQNREIDAEENAEINAEINAERNGEENVENVEKVEKKPSEILWLAARQKTDGAETGVKKIRLAADYFIVRLRRIFKELQTAQETLFSNRNGLFDLVSGNALTPEILAKTFEYFDSGRSRSSDLSDVSTAPAFIKKLKNDFPEVFAVIKSTADDLEKKIAEANKKAREETRKLFKEKNEKLPAELADAGVEIDLFNAVKGFLAHYFDNFDEYDQLSFPVFYETRVGEAARVEVMRISPQDATAIIDERAEKRQKLAGESLFHFGAFLDRAWRFNDILWGRLDGAERLVTALLPDRKYTNLRAFLTRRAHLAIIEEELLAKNTDELEGLLLKSLVDARVSDKNETTLADENLLDKSVKEKVKNLLDNCFDAESAYQFLKKNHTVENRLEPKELLRLISRSTKVTGDILETIAAENDSGASGKIRWISRVATIFWGLVEVAAPDSFWNLLFKRWLTLVYLVEAFLLVGGTLLVKPEIQQFATVSLILTLIIHLTAMTLQDYMRGGKFWNLIRFCAVGVFAFLTIAGGIFIYSFFYDYDLWNSIARLQNNFSKQENYLKLFPVAILLTIFAAMLTWRESGNVRVKFFGAAALVFVAGNAIFAAVFHALAGSSNGQNGLETLVALEFARSADEISRLAGEFGSRTRSGLKWALVVDSCLFVPFYTGFMLIFSRLFNLRRWESKKNLMRAAAVLIVAAALADLVSNAFMYSVLETTDEILRQSPLKINGIWISASAKWLLLAASVGLLSLIFLRKNWWTFFTVGFSCAAVCAVVGVFHPPFLANFMMIQTSLLLALGLLFWFRTDFFSR